jgi:hypothetical protein
MSATEKEIFYEIYGPFEFSVFALFQDQANGYRLTFDIGPEFNVDAIFSDNVTAFKFKANTIFELRVTQHAMKLQFHGSRLRTRSGLVQTSGGGAADLELVPMCGSIFCSGSKECPEPDKPVYDCDLNDCVEPQL